MPSFLRLTAHRESHDNRSDNGDDESSTFDINSAQDMTSFQSSTNDSFSYYTKNRESSSPNSVAGFSAVDGSIVSNFYRDDEFFRDEDSGLFDANADSYTCNEEDDEATKNSESIFSSYDEYNGENFSEVGGDEEMEVDAQMQKITAVSFFQNRHIEEEEKDKEEKRGGEEEKKDQEEEKEDPYRTDPTSSFQHNLIQVSSTVSTADHGDGEHSSDEIITRDCATIECSSSSGSVGSSSRCSTIGSRRSEYMVMTPILQEDGEIDGSTPPNQKDDLTYTHNDEHSTLSSYTANIDDDTPQIQEYSEAASEHLPLGQYDQAMKQYKKIVIHARETIENLPQHESAPAIKYHQYLIIADTLNNIGVMHEMQGEYGFGLQACQEALDIYKEAAEDIESGNEQEENEYLENVKRTTGNIAQMHSGKLSSKERTRLHVVAFKLINNDNNACIKQLKDAITVYKQVLALERRTLGRAHPEVGRTLVKLGEVHTRLNQHNKSMQSLNMALFILKSSLGEYHPDVALAHLSIAQVHNKLSEYSEANLAFKTALDIQKSALGEFHISIASIWNNIGVVNFREKNYCEAIKNYEKAMVIYKYNFGHNYHVEEVALTWNNIGECHRARNEYEEALVVYETALCIFRETVGGGHEHVASTLLNMGEIHTKNQKYGVAMKVYEEALMVQRCQLGSNHVEVSGTLKRIGCLHEKHGHLETALRCYKDAHEIRIAALGENHVDNARCAHSIGILYEKKGKYDEALVYHKEALRLYRHVAFERKVAKKVRDHMMKCQLEIESRQSVLGVPKRFLPRGKGSDYCTHLDARGDSHARGGDLEAAKVAYHEALRIRRKTKGVGHMDVALTLSNLALIHKKMRETTEAVALYAESLRLIRANGFSDSHPYVKDIASEMTQIQSGCVY